MRGPAARDKMDLLRYELDRLWLAPAHDYQREGEIYEEMRALIPECQTSVRDGKPIEQALEEYRARSAAYAARQRRIKGLGEFQGSRWVTNGQESFRISKAEHPPEGWHYGVHWRGYGARSSGVVAQ